MAIKDRGASEGKDQTPLERSMSPPEVHLTSQPSNPSNSDNLLLKNPIASQLPPETQWKKGLKMFGRSKEPPVILVDMDNTLTDWEKNFEVLMSQHHPTVPLRPSSERTEFKIEMNYKDEYRNQILHLTSLENFWLAMNPVPGAVRAVNEMVELGLVVFIVTTPDEQHTARSAMEKIVWIEKNLGTAWKYRALLTHDKTLIKGDILIDDKPGASIGVLQPSWTHLLFTQPYNKDLECPRLENWSEWGISVYRLLVQRETRAAASANDAPHNEYNYMRNSVRHQLHQNILTPARVFAASPRTVRMNPSTLKSRACCGGMTYPTFPRNSLLLDCNHLETPPAESPGKTNV